jgi:hypothetical protein
MRHAELGIKYFVLETLYFVLKFVPNEETFTVNAAVLYGLFCGALLRQSGWAW